MSLEKDTQQSPVGQPAEANKLSQSGLIDLGAVRLSQDFSALAKTEKLLTHVPVRKPVKHQFFRVHPDEDYRLEVAAVELDRDEIYLIHPSIVGAIPDMVRPIRLHLYVTRQGALGLWPVKLPGEDGKVNPWHQSAAEAAQVAMGKWIRLIANMDLGAYDVIAAENIPTEPGWPNKTMSELVNKAFQDHYVDSEDHPLLKELLGIG